MGTSTRSGPVRSNDTDAFQVVSVAANTGVETVIARGQQTGYAHGVTVNSTAGDSPTIGEWAQPAGTLITDIKIFCVIAPITATGDMGFEVGTTSAGAQIVAQTLIQLFDEGTTVAVGNVTLPTLVLQTESGVTAPASVQYTASARTIYCNIINEENATTAGSFSFLIEYVYVA